MPSGLHARVCRAILVYAKFSLIKDAIVMEAQNLTVNAITPRNTNIQGAHQASIIKLSCTDSKFIHLKCYKCF